ncbi:MAG: DUF302 domain-containing protein [Thiobacillus sp.]|nr:DUF302 domain-containing protein [Thiobacillus sp.]
MRTSMFALLFALSLVVPAAVAAPQPVKAAPTDVYKVAIDRSVSLADAADSMRLRANALNLKLVAELPLSKQVEVMTDTAQRTITIFQFCDAVTAKDLIELNLDFSVYMPCRIALIEDEKGQGWLVMMDVNVDVVAKEKRLPAHLKARIEDVRKSLVSIMQAGARGEL